MANLGNGMELTMLRFTPATNYVPTPDEIQGWRELNSSPGRIVSRTSLRVMHALRSRVDLLIACRQIS